MPAEPGKSYLDLHVVEYLDFFQRVFEVLLVLI
jgi:hypothetical protein